MKSYLALCFGIIVCVAQACSDDKEQDEPTPPIEKDLIKAADVSFLPAIREEGTVFFNAQQQEKDVLDILKDAGCNTIRLRLWHTPVSDRSSLNEVVQFAVEARSKGFKLWITVHYSDTWADPGTQTKPTAWQNLSFAHLTDSVFKYTSKVAKLLTPEYIQIGNEINGGMIWPEGSISNRSNFVTLLKSGVSAVREVSPNTKIMMHYAGVDGDWFYAILKDQQVDYDLIALSYYPRWHSKNLTEVGVTLQRLSNANNKDIVLAETAYPFTLEWNDWTNNLIGENSHLVSGYPATAAGQKEFLLKMRSLVETTTRGVGFAYWAPEWVAYRGDEATDGSAWENMTLFDFDKKALPGLEVFKD